MSAAAVGTLVVWWEQQIVGVLALDRHGAMRFAYRDDWLSDDAAPPLSLSLPKRPGPFSHRRCAPFFEGLLPEGTERDAVAGTLGVSPDHAFGILAGVGGEVAGAVSLWPEGQVPPGSHAATPDPLATDLATPDPLATPNYAAKPARSLSDPNLVRLLDKIRTRPLLANGEEGLRLSLAGAQSKLPVVVADGRIGLPLPGGPTTHILKPADERFPAITENEAFAMRLAVKLKLSVAPVEPRVVRGRLFLLVERYDRDRMPDGSLRRLHQEDFCQALGIVPRLKYAADGGPGFSQCFELVRRACARPDAQLRKLLDAVIFHVLVGNADAHGKNYSLLRRGPGFGVLEVAPLYDVLCTVAYPGLSPKLAMKIGECATLEELRPKDWTRFAQRCGVGAAVISRRIAELCDRAVLYSDAVARELVIPGLDYGALLHFADLIRRRAAILERSI